MRAWRVLAVLGLSSSAAVQAAPFKATSNLLIVLDGLRPDYVTPELMPILHGLSKRGMTFTNHHAVYPTVTRLNAASIATGAYPGTHGILGNSVYFPQVEPGKGLDTGSKDNLVRINEAVDGVLVTAVTLGEALQAAGKKVMVVSSGSSGSAYLLNHKIAGGAIVHYAYTLPAALEERVAEVLGAAPEDGTPNAGRNRRAVDAYLKLGLEEMKPDLCLMWLSDPDHTAHKYGIGAPETVRALKLVDDELGRILKTLTKKGMLKKVNIFVTSDHGFSTHNGGPNAGKLFKEFRSPNADGISNLVVVGGALYVRDRAPETITRLVVKLQQTEGIGAIFSPARSPGNDLGVVPGTLSFELINWAHPRSAELLIAADWTANRNEHGYKGTTALGGVAGHGTPSPYDVHNTLIAAGPDIRRKTTSTVPTGNVDLAPTLCHLFGLAPPSSMDGRVIKEAFRDGPAPAELPVEKKTVSTAVAIPGGRYTLTAHQSIVDGHAYFDYAEVERSKVSE